MGKKKGKNQKIGKVNPFLYACIYPIFKRKYVKKYNITFDKEIVKAYRAALDYATSRIRNYCNSRGGDYLLASSDEPVGDILFGKLVEMGVLK